MHCNGISTGIVNDTLELMQNVKEVLLRLQQSHTETDLTNTIPDTTPAILNLANIYGCKHLVAFLFVTEGMLNRVRAAELRPKAELIILLLICCEHVSTMVSQLANRGEIYLGHINRSHGLMRRLRVYQGNKVGHAAAA